MDVLTQAQQLVLDLSEAMVNALGLTQQDEKTGEELRKQCAAFAESVGKISASLREVIEALPVVEKEDKEVEEIEKAMRENEAAGRELNQEIEEAETLLSQVTETYRALADFELMQKTKSSSASTA